MDGYLHVRHTEVGRGGRLVALREANVDSRGGVVLEAVALKLVRARVNIQSRTHCIDVKRVDSVEVRGSAADAGSVEVVRRGRGGARVGLDGGSLGGTEAGLGVRQVGELALQAVGRVVAVDLCEGGAGEGYPGNLCM